MYFAKINWSQADRRDFRQGGAQRGGGFRTQQTRVCPTRWTLRRRSLHGVPDDQMIWRGFHHKFWSWIENVCTYWIILICMYVIIIYVYLYLSIHIIYIEILRRYVVIHDYPRWTMMMYPFVTLWLMFQCLPASWSGWEVLLYLGIQTPNARFPPFCQM